jgi:hypothetical protein
MKEKTKKNVNQLLQEIIIITNAFLKVKSANKNKKLARIIKKEKIVIIAQEYIFLITTINIVL